MRTTEEIAAAVKELLAGGRLTYSQLAERYRSDLPCSLRTAKTHLEILREEIDRCGGSWYGIDRVRHGLSVIYSRTDDPARRTYQRIDAEDVSSRSMIPVLLGNPGSSKPLPIIWVKPYIALPVLSRRRPKGWPRERKIVKGSRLKALRVRYPTQGELIPGWFPKEVMEEAQQAASSTPARYG